MDVSNRQPSCVVTLQLDDPSFLKLQEWRTRHFPSELNFIPAHLTLFHKVSHEQVTRLRDSWKDFEQLAPIALDYAAPRLLGRGVAIDVDSAGLLALRVRLARVLAGALTRQDQQPFRPHVTIQNKVRAEKARALHRFFISHFEPWHGEGTAVQIWHYLGGPWQPHRRLVFAGRASDDIRE